MDNSAWLTLNGTFSDPFVYAITGRGAFSEINCLLGAIVFGLVNKKRIIVDTGVSGAFPWNAVFAGRLPEKSEADRGACSADWRIQGVRTPNFGLIRRWTADHYRDRTVIDLPELGLHGDMFDVKRALALSLCVPATLHEPGASWAQAFLSAHRLSERCFAAFHARKGDKVKGYQGRRGLVIEGEDSSIEAYLDLMEKTRPDLRTAYIMTDDYSVIEDANVACAERGIEVLHTAKPEMRGYHQAEFSQLDAAAKRSEMVDLIEEVTICARSDLFLGGFKSNVARYVTLVHKTPDACFSVDRNKSWTPS